MNRELRELIIMMTDAYKLFHRQMYPKNTITVYSNATARNSRHYKGKNKDEVVVFGTQRVTRKLKDKFDEFFAIDAEELETFLKEQLATFTGADYCVKHIMYLHSLGYVPLVIKSLREGSKCPIGVPYLTVYNTDHKCFWLTNYIESWLSSEIWHFITNATIANEYRETFDKWAMKTVGNTDFVQFQGHDFSSRGDYGWEAATAVGLAHNTSFVGGDNVSSYLDAQYYYDAPKNDWVNMVITQTSVPASEHSVQCAHYDPEKGTELEYLDHLLAEFPSGPLSIVCDGMDYWSFLTVTVPQRKAEIMARDGKVIFRPDSGNIVDIICGNPNTSFANNETEYKGSIEVLWQIFGGTKTEKGYILLDEHVGLIYGDSVTLDIADEVCTRLADKGFASINWVAGIGSYTYQFNTRDSHGQALKATYVEFLVDGEIVGKNIFKDPKTGDGTKKSAKGLLQVKGDTPSGQYKLKDQVSWAEEDNSHLQKIFKDGKFYNQTTLEEVRNRLRK
jgi:nicotinamide phosphoribosyltransferase